MRPSFGSLNGRRPELVGTFHAIGARLLREHAEHIGLDRAFTIHDREDSADLMNLVRHDRGLSKTKERFPAKNTCLAIYSRAGATGDEAGVPLRDEDYLILSTIHSAKGQEWKAVFVLNCVDGCIPSDLAIGTAPEIEEERRLLYVALSARRRKIHSPRHCGGRLFKNASRPSRKSRLM